MSLRDAITSEHPDFAAGALDENAWKRLERLAVASPLYAHFLRQFPERCGWLEEPHNLRTTYRYRAFVDEWRAFRGPDALENDNELLSRLRRWRRLMSLRIAYRSVNGLADEPTCAAELTRLAEFCLGECYKRAQSRWVERLGRPWDEALDQPARFCVLALGKLGGEELNFSSDIDLIFFYEGEGYCKRDGVPTPHATPEFFTRLAETLARWLNQRTGDGFLFRVDTRLRPDGVYGALVPSLAAIENHYSTIGQTWERMALVKARPVAGDLGLGSEFLESLHSFRYPRHPPPSLLMEVAEMKLRTERELVAGSAKERDLKRGPGGIREIEFIVQSLQLLNAGRLPFLQSHSTGAALGQLARYQLLSPDDARFLGDAYWFLRTVEHRVQMRDEQQTHALPDDESIVRSIAAGLGFAAADLNRTLAARRERVRRLYDGLFADQAVDPEFDLWWTFLTSDAIPPEIGGRLRRWFGDGAEAAAALRVFIWGDHRRQVTRELVARFRHLAASFDVLMPELARPLETLARLARFAERYGTRQQFFNGCADNPQLLRVLALLFDRSGYVVELLCAHPEILEEVLRPENLRHRKSAADILRELSAGPTGAARNDWLWLYVRAEQVRHAIGELLGFETVEQVELGLTQLADLVLAFLTRAPRGESLVNPGVPDAASGECASAGANPKREGAEESPATPGLLVVALGKYGGAELTIGSDLDVLLVSENPDSPRFAAGFEELRRTLRHGGPLGPMFELDLRLRPHGMVGPNVVTMETLRDYHSGGGAQTWEKQLLTRARVVSGPPALADRFLAWRDELVYSHPVSEGEVAEIWAMRLRIERERDPVDPPERAFKTGAGGLADFEFLVQIMEMRHGAGNRGLRVPGTRAALNALAKAGVITQRDAGRLLENHAFLKRVELAVRRDVNRAASVLGATPAERFPLARWLGFPDEAEFWGEHVRRLRETRQIVVSIIGDPIAEEKPGSRSER